MTVHQERPSINVSTCSRRVAGVSDAPVSGESIVEYLSLRRGRQHVGRVDGNEKCAIMKID